MHQFPIRVYYEDTDLAGIVYYANYLKFIERGRSEWLRDLGIDQVVLKREGMVFVVRRVEADYLAPAHFDDHLSVESQLHEIGSARIAMRQSVIRAGKTLFSALVTLVCINDAGRPVRIPPALVAQLTQN
ncbi:tol-pal system-associated acyl-CoA thioesterase [Paracoccus limosus]|jgi:acyl-CoA thioester hydrolase|uniref:Tol-pal system-associated acyl-CoA thioesterase n=1 Tax=Paracoccus limosus TaxID=913252 RepID=A0A844HB63_9RHOB|nr:tol-pal system-associated acyl-CoA thioesterase [Paracoccus limosus]MTH36447.1 tol-pal system-associated acyl-CoA thioesterase [Paracoccus limosus]